MGGHFTQRGEPAILSKWDRTRMALACGADAVFELPALFAARPADAFAGGGVYILDALGADALSFGSELEDMALLGRLAELRDHEPEAVSAAVRRGLEAGKSHARAWGEAVGGYLGRPGDWIGKPNTVLAVEYLRALRRCQSAMTACAVPRQGDYHDERLGEIASATAIRAAFARGDGEQALLAIPEAARPFATPDSLHPMDDLLLYILRGMDLDALAALPEVGEGLEHRILRLCRECATREALLEALKCKRYTRARLARILTAALIGLDRRLVDAVPKPTYARLLGARVGAEPLLGELKRRSRLTIVSGGAALRGEPCFELECRATDVWALLHDAPALRLPGREFTEKVIRLPAPGGD